MAEHLEVELKWALDVASHGALAPLLTQSLGQPRTLVQHNRFFDTADRRLRQAKLNLRLRRENAALLLTCKGHLGIGANGEHRHTEWEEWLDPAWWNDIDQGVLDAARLPLPEQVRQALGGAELTSLGGFANHRLEFHQDGEHSALLCLDRTDFPGGRIDHELEIETASPQVNDQRWRQQLQQWGIPFRLQPLTKFVRFLQTRG